MRTITEQVKSNPVLADVAIEAVKAQLLTLAWVDQAFGRAWPISMDKNGKKVVEPCVYTSGNSYETLIPSADLGNYTFFVLRDAARVTEDMYYQPYALIVWYDMRECFDNGANRRDTENLKKDIIDVLRDVIIKHGSITLDKVYEVAKSVYKEFTIDETWNQSLVQPYGAMRFEGEIIMEQGCFLN